MQVLRASKRALLSYGINPTKTNYVFHFISAWSKNKLIAFMQIILQTIFQILTPSKKILAVFFGRFPSIAS